MLTLVLVKDDRQTVSMPAAFWRFLGPLIGVIAGLIALIGVFLWQSNQDVSFEIAKGLMSLTIALIVTGLLSFIITERARRRAKEDDDVQVLVGALQDLKAAFEKVAVARFFLASHPTALGFEQQMPAIAEARQRLQKAQRERLILGTDLGKEFQRMLDYLSHVGEEYLKNYDDILVASLREQGQRDKIKSGERTAMLDAPRLTDKPDIYPCLTEFTRDKWTDTKFHAIYSVLARKLADRIDKILKRNLS